MAKRIIISGGGTGGHVFPAISIANALVRADKDCLIHFVGAKGKLEMTKVPEAGYEISGLPVAGFRRKLSLKNIGVVIKLINSINKARRIIRSFRPDVVVGVGGYASGPVLRVAQKRGIPTLIQEQNSYAGITNKLLAKKARRICVAYEGMDKYFPADKIVLTGNPIRKDLLSLDKKREEGKKYFKLKSELPVVLSLGGSGGSRTINESIADGLSRFEENGIQIIWQTGGYYFDEMKEIHKEYSGNLSHIHAFITRMDLAFSVADIIVSRAGAGTISELSIVGKPVILIPSPNVAEDHQTRNAEALTRKEAAIMIKDEDARQNLTEEIINLIADNERKTKLSENIAKMAIKDSDMIIANEILRLIND